MLTSDISQCLTTLLAALVHGTPKRGDAFRQIAPAIRGPREGTFSKGLPVR